MWSVSSCETYFMKIESYRRCNRGFRVYPPLYMSWLVAKPRRNWKSAMIFYLFVSFSCNLCQVLILFLTSELANKAEIYILSARDTTRAWVPGRGIMGNDVRVYKTMYNTGLSSRLQNQPRSLARLIFPFTVRSPKTKCST